MGRTATGWKLRQRAPTHAFTARIWLNGRELERSTGTRDPQEAAREAARIYAAEVAREPRKRQVVRRGGLTLEELIAAWVVSLESTHDADTVETWELYANTHWHPHFKEAANLTNAAMIADYVRVRLRKVQGVTVGKELSAFRRFLAWCVEVGEIGEAPEVPSVPKRTVGTVYEKRRRVRAFELSPAECKAIIADLPEWSTSKRVARFPIRARFLVGYETGLRPEMLDLLEAPRHYRKGSRTVSISAEIDKNRLAREIPISLKARRALDAVCPEEGLVFGAHDYREHLAKAARVVLDNERAGKFAGTHLRSARITHWLEKSKNLAGVQWLSGHLDATTTAGYVRASLRAGLEVVRGEDARAARRTKKRKAG